MASSSTTVEEQVEMEGQDQDQSDSVLLSSLGVDLIGREEFESNFIHRLQEQFNDDSSQGQGQDQQLDQKEESNDSSIIQEIPQQCKDKEKSDNDAGKSLHNKNHSSSLSSPSSLSSSSILQRILVQGKIADKAAAEREKRVKAGEMTPFGTTITKQVVIPAPEPIDDTFSRYLQSQKTLNQQFQRQKKSQLKKKKKKQRNVSTDYIDKEDDSDDSDVQEVQVQDKQPRVSASQSQGQGQGRTTKKRKSRSSKDPLDMKILFPKKKKKKIVLGTRESEDPRDARRIPGKSKAETTSMYLNESDDSDHSEYIPPSSDDDESDDSTNKTGSRKLRQTNTRTVQMFKNRSSSKYNESGDSNNNDDDDDWDSDDDYQGGASRSSKKGKKETDDGHLPSYKSRLTSWKATETRLSSGAMHKLDDNFHLPQYLWDSLYKYQQIGLKWLLELHVQRTGGILGDEMGLGKTIQIIAFLATLSCSNVLERFSAYRGLGPSLIICPATIMHQWVQEFHTWWPPFRVAILHESGSFTGNKKALIQSIQSRGGILITTYHGLVNNASAILSSSWHYVIVDEGHKIRNPDAQITLTLKQITTPHRILCSGSPLQNNLKELWSLFDFIYPGRLGTLPSFIESFSIPITQGGYSNANEVQVATAYKCATMLRSLISPYLLRRLKSDVNAHLQLPSKNEQVLFCQLSPSQKALYKAYVESKEIMGVLRGNSNVFVGLINLRKICNHPHLFDRTSAAANAEVFGHWSESGKMIVVKTLLRLWKAQGHKVLLFTQSRQMLCILEAFLRSEGYAYLRLDGTTSIAARQPLIAQFNSNPEIFIFLLTTRVGGLGVNLTGANRLLLFDPDWNPSTDLQARERAWRIGQSRSVTIYRLICSGTIEEKIYHRQIFKQFLTARVLNNPKQRRFFKANDLLELFSYTEGSGKNSEATESEAIFAGTGSKVKLGKKAPKEKASGKFKGIPYLVKQRPLNEENSTDNKNQEEDEDAEKAEYSSKQDDYVLRKLFKKSGGITSALRHDRIVDSNESDYLLVEKEAERVAKDAIRVLKAARKQCWGPESGRVSWTGSHGELKPIPEPSPAKKPLFGPKKKPPSQSQITQEPEPSTSTTDQSTSSFFSTPKLPGDSELAPMSSSDLIALIRSRNQPLVETSRNSTEGEQDQEEAPADNSMAGVSNVRQEQLELLYDIRSFIAFRAMIDGQASTDELLAEFGSKLPPSNSILFKQMLNQLCTHRQVEGKRLWRLKPEFR